MIHRETAPETSGREGYSAAAAGTHHQLGPLLLRSATHPVQVPSRARDTETCPPLPAPPPKAGQERALRPAPGWGGGPGRLPTGRARGGGARGCPGWVGLAGPAGKAPEVLANGKRLCPCASRWSSVSRAARGRERKRADGCRAGRQRGAGPPGFRGRGGMCGERRAGGGPGGARLVLDRVWRKRELLGGAGAVSVGKTGRSPIPGSSPCLATVGGR